MAIQIKKNNNASKAIHKLNEQSLNNKNKSSKTDKDSIFSKLTKYSKNVLSSAKNLSLEVVGEYVPNAKDIAEDIKSNVQESLEDAKKTAAPIINFAKSKLNNSNGDSLSKKVSNTIKKNKDELLQRLKTGKFYKSQDELANEGASELFDNDFGDMDFGFDDDYDFSDDSGTYVTNDGGDILPEEPFSGIIHSQSLVTNVSAKNRQKFKSRKLKSNKSSKVSSVSRGIGEYRLGDEMVSSSIIDIGNALLEQNENIWARNFAASEQHNASIVSYSNHILTGINALVEFNNNITSEVAKSTIEFHEKSLAASQDTIDLLKEIKDSILVTSTYKQEEVKRKEYLNGKNLGKDYYKQIGENINYVLEDYGLGGIGDMLSIAADSLEMSSELGMKFDPISALIKIGTKSLVSNANKGKFKLLNDRLENFGSSFIGKMNELSKYGNGFGRVLGNVLGIKEKPIRKSNNMGLNDVNAVVGWTSKSDRTLNEVIPTYLRKILSATSGQDELIYDYSTGRMTSAKGIRKLIEDKQKLASTNDTIRQYNLRIASIGSNSLFSTDEFKKNMLDAVKSGEVSSEEEYKEKVAKNSKKNIDGIVKACVRTGIPFNSARAAMNDFNNDYAKSLIDDLDGSDQEKRTALIMLCEAFNKMSRREQDNFNGGILKAFTETQNNYNSLQEEMKSKGFGSFYSEISLDDEIKELQRSLKKDRSLNMEGKYERGKGGRLQIKRMENSIDRLKELQLLEYSRGNKPDITAVGNFNIENGSGTSSIPGTVNNIFKLLVEGIPVYSIPIGKDLPSHLKDLRKALNVSKEEKIDFEEEEKLAELYKSISDARFKEKNHLYFGADSIGSAFLDKFRNNKFNKIIGKGIDGSIALYDMLLGQTGEYGKGIFSEISLAEQERERKKSQINTIDKTIDKIKEKDFEKYLKEINKDGKMSDEEIKNAKEKYYNEYDFSKNHKRKAKAFSTLRQGLENDLKEFSDGEFNKNNYYRENGGFDKLSRFSDTYINDYYSLKDAYKNNKNKYKNEGSYFYGINPIDKSNENTTKAESKFDIYDFFNSVFETGKTKAKDFGAKVMSSNFGKNLKRVQTAFEKGGTEGALKALERMTPDEIKELKDSGLLKEMASVFETGKTKAKDFGAKVMSSFNIEKGMSSNDKLSSIINGLTDEKAIKSAKRAGIGAGIFTLLSQMNHTMASTLKLLGGNDKGELDEKNKETIAGQLNGINSGDGVGDDNKKKNSWMTPGLAMLAVQLLGGLASSKGILKRFKNEGFVSGMASLTGLDDEANSMYNADGTRKSGVQMLGDRITRETRKGIIMGGEREIVKNAGKGLKNTQLASLGKKMISNSKRLYTAFSKGGAKGGFKAISRMTKQGAKSAIDAVVKSFKDNIVNFFTNNKILSKLKISKDLGKKLGSEIGEKVAKNVAKESTKAAGKGITGAIKAVPVVGWVIAAADVLWQISEGYNLAGRYFNVSPNDVTPTMRTVSMIVKGVKALITNLLSITGLGIAIATGIEIIVPDKWLVETIYNVVSSKEEKEAREEAQRKQIETAEALGITSEGLAEAQNKSTFEKMTTGVQTIGSKLFGKGKSYDQISREKTLKKVNKQRAATGQRALSYDEFKSKDSTTYKSSIIDKIKGLRGDSSLSEFDSVKENFDNILNSGDTNAVKEIVDAAKERDANLPPLTKDIGTLTPSFREKWEQLLSDPEIVAAGINPKITGARRPLATQLALYTKGRSDPNVLDIAAKSAGFTNGKNFWSDQTSQVTWTLKSKHLGGNALDIDTRGLSKDQLDLLGKKAKEYGIEWGGLWPINQKDEPHFEDSAPVQSFSRGGIVSGKRDRLYGDKVKARLNPKEMVLNETQQASLFGLIKSAENKLNSSGQSIQATFKNPFVKDTEMTNEMIDKALLIQSKIYEEQKRHNSIAEKFFEALIKMIATSINAPNPNIGSGNRRNTEESFSDSLIAGAKAIAAGL